MWELSIVSLQFFFKSKSIPRLKAKNQKTSSNKLYIQTLSPHCTELAVNSVPVIFSISYTLKALSVLFCFVLIFCPHQLLLMSSLCIPTKSLKFKQLCCCSWGAQTRMGISELGFSFLKYI